MKNFLWIIIFYCISICANAQSIKGLYVDGFATILGNAPKEDSILHFAKNNGFNYLTLYQMHIINASTPLNNASACTTFTNFIRKAKTQFGILQIGVAGENYNFFANTIYPYNQQHISASEKIDVYNLEFEFWVPSSILPGGAYCVDYLSNAGFTCDSTGAFGYYKQMLHQIDSLANADASISETYFGWFSDLAAAEIMQSGIDRILLSVYITSANYSSAYQYNYIKNRLESLGSNNTTIKVLPIYSAEPNFMQTWAATNPFFTPYLNMQNSLLAESAAWKNNIELEGIQWFAYTDMPKKNMTLLMNNRIKTEIEIYPNPSKHTFLIKSESNILTLHIYDGNGKVIYTAKPSALQLEISTTGFASGIYSIVIRTNNSSILKKMIIE